VKRFGGSSEGGMDRRKVVDVPNDNNASPGADNATTVAGLSPVNGTTIHSTNILLIHFQPRMSGQKVLTRIESPFLNPIFINFSKYRTSSNRFGSKFGTQSDTPTTLQQLIIPFTSQNIHKVHPTGIRYFNRCDSTQEYRWYE